LDRNKGFARLATHFRVGEAQVDAQALRAHLSRTLKNPLDEWPAGR
jgi:hypothetical protein